MAAPSRLQLARRRLRVARYSISAVALGAFGAFAVAVRDAHPATHTKASTATSSAAASASAADSDDAFGNGAAISPAPQTLAPQVQSSGS
jgi:hypothetical protein